MYYSQSTPATLICISLLFLSIMHSVFGQSFEKDSRIIHDLHRNKNSLTMSYFDTIYEATNKIRFLSTENDAQSTIVRLKNLSNDIFHIHRKVTNLIFNDDKREKENILTGLLGERLRHEISDNYGQNYTNRMDKILFKVEQYFDELFLLNGAETENSKDFKVDNKANVSTCSRDIAMLMKGLEEREEWALPFFDACGKPGPSLLEFRFGFVGNYDQCRNSYAPNVSYIGNKTTKLFRGNYLTSVIQLTGIPIQVKLGVCLPDTCNDLESTIFLYEIFGQAVKSKVIQYIYAYSQTGKTEMTAATIAAICILSLVGSLAVVGTFYDVIFVQRPKWKNTKSFITNLKSIDYQNGGDHVVISQKPIECMDNNSEKRPLLQATPGHGNGPQDRKDNPVKETQSRNIAADILLAFSLYSNGKKLLSTDQLPGSLGSIHGIRYLSMSWVVMCHTFGNVSNFAANMPTAYPEFLKRWTFTVISNGFASVDTFFTLSGLLTSYLTTKEMMKRETWKINWGLFYFHRYWRLTPPYMFALVLVLGLNQYLGQGPLWPAEQPYDKKNCEDNWWTNLLYVNNLVNTDKGCFGHAWYLANDMQFFVTSPLLILPFFFHQAFGVVVWGVFLIAHWSLVGGLSEHNKWSLTQESLKIPKGRAPGIDWFTDYYITPWCRVGPFVVGILAGYILAVTNGGKIKMSKVVAVIGWVVSIGTGLGIVYGIHGDITGEHPSDIPTSAFYNAVNRSLWGACVSWVIIACSAGYGEPVTSLLSWSPFVVLGRLSYMIYLIHICFLNTFFSNMDALIIVNDTNIIVIYVGILLIVTMASVVFVLLLESPMIGLERVFIKKK